MAQSGSYSFDSEMLSSTGAAQSPDDITLKAAELEFEAEAWHHEQMKATEKQMNETDILLYRYACFVVFNGNKTTWKTAATATGRRSKEKLRFSKLRHALHRPKNSYRKQSPIRFSEEF